MRKLTELYKIDGQPMYAPDTEAEYSTSDLDGDDSGRDESGVMRRTVVRYDVGTWGINYTWLTDAELQYTLGLLRGKSQFEFTHPVAGNSKGTETTTCYCSKKSMGLKNAVTGKWSSVKFNIIEC